MLIEFTKSWRQFKPGQRTDFFTDGQADILFRRKVAKEVLVEAPATVSSAVETVVVSEPVIVPPEITPAIGVTNSRIGIRKPGK